jgi:asparagine synthase (glutamine-hydrolysing)
VSAIAGILRRDGRPDAKDDLERMMRALAALGPDRAAFWHDGAVALGMRQMAMLPEDRFDRQPWRARDGGLVLVANARIDNRAELARALGLAADAQQVMSDSEMLLVAYERWGRGCLDRIVGEFAFAAWDARERRLFCARSHLRGPTLYYHCSARFFAFATTASGLFALPDVPRALDERRLACGLALLPGETNGTFYRDIFCVPPGHCLSVSDDEVKLERYWRLDVTRRIRLASDGDYVDALRETFAQAVAAHLRSIHPVGTHLSSGCDSTAVTAMAARLQQPARQDLTAFTAAPRAGYGEPGNIGRVVDESPLAAEIAARLGNVCHIVVRPDEQRLLNVIHRGHGLYGRPIQLAMNLGWIERILEAARKRGIRVLLTGAGGNMSISYDGLPRLAALFRTGHWLALARETAALRSHGIGRRRLIDIALGPFMPGPLWRRWARSGKARTLELADYCAINPAFAAEVGLPAIARSMGRSLDLRPEADGRIGRRRYFEANDGGDFRIGFLGGWGIDVRDPTCDRRLVEFCLAIPDDQFLRGGERKFLYRRAFETIIPAAEIVARKFGYQGADWHEGLTAARDDIASELDRLERSAPARRALDLPRLRRLVEDWPSGGWHRSDVAENYRLLLVRALAAGMFIRWVESGGE